MESRGHRGGLLIFLSTTNIFRIGEISFESLDLVARVVPRPVQWLLLHAVARFVCVHRLVTCIQNAKNSFDLLRVLVTPPMFGRDLVAARCGICSFSSSIL